MLLTICQHINNKNPPFNVNKTIKIPQYYPIILFKKLTQYLTIKKALFIYILYYNTRDRYGYFIGSFIMKIFDSRLLQ